MVRSRRSISKEDAVSVLTDSGISLSSPPPPPTVINLDDDEEEILINKLCVTDDEDEDDDDYVEIQNDNNNDNNHHAVVEVDDDEEKLDKVVEKAVKNLKQPHKQEKEEDDCKVEPLAAPPAKRARKSHICSVCQKEFGGKTDLKRHMLIHSDERPFKCEQCGKSYRQAINLKNHITTAHVGQKQFSCTLCPKSFALKERLRLHMRLHSGEKPYGCTLCDKRFARGGQLQNHMVSHHKGSLKKYTCEKCSSTFSTPANLRAHMERHEQGADLYCEECSEHFPNEVVLRAHINKMHYKVDKFVCEICKKTIDDEDLATHLKMHTNVKTHICEICKSYFTQKSQYNVHMRMHTGERPFQCKICWQTFAHSSVLKLHIRKHTGEKPFNCLLCKDEVGFSQLAHLKTHMKKIHKQNKTYKCDGCSQFFKIKIELQAHMEKCKNCQLNVEEENIKNNDMQTLTQLRFFIAMLLKRITSEEKLKKLGYEKRLIDNVVMASLKVAKRKVYDDHKLSAIERLRLNIGEFLDWIVPANQMEKFREQQLTVECILEKIVTTPNKQSLK